MKQSPCSSVFGYVFYPMIAIFDWFLSKVSLSRDELEMFEKLLETAFWGGGSFFYDRWMGEKKLREVIVSCDDLYHRISNKWFPNIEGLLFLRQNLIKIKMRVCAALGEKEQVALCYRQMDLLGIDIPEDIKEEMEYLSIAVRYPLLIRGCNLIFQGVALFCSLLLGKKRGRRDSNPQLPP